MYRRLLCAIYYRNLFLREAKTTLLIVHAVCTVYHIID